jgi:non-specific serine/threonine protein kinase
MLDSLRAYHGGNIYLMGPPGLVGAGFGLYHENPVASIEWSEDFSCLWIRIGRRDIVVVNILLKENRPLFSCTCYRGSKGSGCEHVICSILTIKNLLLPEVFKPKHPNPAYRKALLSGLTGLVQEKPQPAPGAAEYSLVLERKDSGGIDVFVTLNRERVTNLAELLHTSFLDFAAAGLNSFEKADLLVRFLKKHGNRYPILVRSSGKNHEATYEPGYEYGPFTELALEEGTVFIIRRLRGPDGRIAPFLSFGDLVYLPDDGKLALIEHARGWETWRLFASAVFDNLPRDDDDDPDESIVPLPAEFFNRFQFVIPAHKHVMPDPGALFTVNNKTVRPVGGTFEHRLTIVPSKDDPAMVVLRPECLHGSYLGPIPTSRFRFLEDAPGRLPHYLKAKKRKEALVRAFFELAEAKTELQAEKIITRALNDGEVVKRDMRNDARRLLLQLRREGRTDAGQVLALDNEWRFVLHDRQQDSLLFKAPYDVFGWEIFDGTERAGEMRVSMEQLAERLPLLCERLAGRNIGLFLSGKPVKQAKWELAIDATHKTGIDWFELRPEIRCNGRVLDGLSLDRLFAGQGALEQDDVVQLFDSNLRQALARIEAAYRAAQTDGKRERELVRVPRLQILDWAELRSSGVTVKLLPEDEEILRRLLHFDRVERKPLPQGLAATLRHYQRDGYDWLAFLYEHRFGACLADDMGLGKTVQAIALLAGVKEGLVKASPDAQDLPHLIVVPPSLVFNWEHELDKFYPGLKIHVYTGIERSADFRGADIVLTTYATARRDIETLLEQRFHVIIFDEAQAVKNIYADTTAAVRRLNGVFKLTMTGTPLENHLGEYYSIIDLALPGLLGEYDAFRPLIKSGAEADLELVIRRTMPFVLRRTKEEVLTELPPKTETDIYLDLTEEQKALYQKTVAQVRTTIGDAYQTKTQAQARIIALTAILKLRQICITPQLVDPELSGVSPKTDFLIDRLRELKDENHSALVFSQFTSFLDILQEALAQNGIDCLRLDGATPMGMRKTLVNRFQSGEGPSVFLLSLKAGGQGLNLTRASYVFHLDPWWNPAVENQASDRAHRIGQKNKVTITRLLMQHTIEEKMMELKKRKRALYDAILSDGDGGKRGLTITRSDFEFLLG